MMRRVLALAALLALAGCTDDRAPYWGTECTRYETSLMPMAMANGSGGVSIMLLPTQQCVESRPVCRVGKDYAGPLTSC